MFAVRYFRECVILVPVRCRLGSRHFKRDKYEKNMNFVLKPPGCKLRRLILKKVCAKIKKVIYKDLALRKAYLYVGE